MWILTFIESNNYHNVVWFVDVTTFVGYFTWMSGYWVMALLVLLSSLILPAADPSSFDGFKNSDGTVITGSVEGIISVLLYLIVVGVDTAIQLLWVDCLNRWKDWALFEIDKAADLHTPQLLTNDDLDMNDSIEDLKADKAKADAELETEKRILADADFNFEDASRAVGHWGDEDTSWD